MPKRPSPDELRRQIKAYRKEWRHYHTFAKALKRVLEAACQPHLREAIVQARPKGLSSFAEKCVRKFENYPDPVHQFTDLCGGRVIVQTLTQVASVRQFVEDNFRVVETEDISLRLGKKEFGYRDRHYIVQLKPECAAASGFHPDEIAAIGDRKAELQIRTWAQHAWADTLHDRTYKSPLEPTAEIERRAALLAALMEEGDRNFDGLANELDGLVANYAAHAERSAVEEERELEQLLFDFETDEQGRPIVALRLARLRSALGQQREIIDLLTPLAQQPLAQQDELELELGTALCRLHRREPASPDYQRGLNLLAAVAARLEKPRGDQVLNRRRHDSLRARSLSRLGWACEAEEARTGQGACYHAQALEIEPGNPYYLANLLGFELRSGARAEDLVRSLRPVILAAVRTCETHAAQAMELPFAFFTAGRLRLLLGENEAALQSYLRGAHHCLGGKSCFGCEVIDDEVAWLHRIKYGQPLPPPLQQAKDFLLLAKTARDCTECGDKEKTPLVARAKITPPVLIIGGGAASISQKVLDRLRDPLAKTLRDFRGTVISGGTRSGVPGLVGEIAAQWKQAGRKPFRLIGYRPERLPDDAPRDDRYDESIAVGGQDFTAEQILANWTDILAADIKPKEVRLVGIGGGLVAAVEYRMALALGAEVGIVPGTEGAADAILADPQWKAFTNLLPLPCDSATLRAFLREPTASSPTAAVLEMAKELHARYVAENPKRMTENLRPWEHLPPTYKKANLEQARYAVEILEAAGFGVRPATGAPDAIKSFDGEEFKADVELMAELEHGRWNVERLREGWRPGKVRDNERKIQPCLVPWSEDKVLTADIKGYDYEAVRAFPDLLAKAGLEIFRAIKATR